MKRSQIIELLANWAKPEIKTDIYNDDLLEWADNLLYTLENEYGIMPPYNPRYLDHGSIQDCVWDPEDYYVENTDDKMS